MSETIDTIDADQEDATPEPAASADAVGEQKAGGDDVLVQEGDIAGDYLERLLDLLDYDGDIDLDVEAGRAIVSIDGGEDLEKLVGPRGTVLEALQELTRLAVQQKKNQNQSAQGSSQKKVTKAGSAHGFAQTSGASESAKAADPTPADTNGQNGSKDNGTGVPGLLKDSTRKSGRKRR